MSEIITAIENAVEQKHIMLDKINSAIRDFELQTALIVSSIKLDTSSRIVEAKHTKTYIPALKTHQVEIQLVEL
jgi:PBP1b-binding outer membrane lipoprotein LpoB